MLDDNVFLKSLSSSTITGKHNKNFLFFRIHFMVDMYMFLKRGCLLQIVMAFKTSSPGSCDFSGAEKEEERDLSAYLFKP